MATVSQSLFTSLGLHLPLSGVGILLALTPLTAAYPQQELASGLGECAALSADAERLACYDRLQRGAQPTGEERSDASPADTIVDTAVIETDAIEPTAARNDAGAEVESAAELPIAEDVTERSDSPAEVVQSAERAEETSRRPFWRRLRDRIARRTADTADSTDSDDGTEARSADTRLNEEPANDPPADDVVEVTVVDVRRNLSGLAVFLTEDNGTWVQISTRDRAYPDTPFRARITGGLMRGRFLTPETGGIAVRVRGPD